MPHFPQGLLSNFPPPYKTNVRLPGANHICYDLVRQGNRKIQKVPTTDSMSQIKQTHLRITRDDVRPSLAWTDQWPVAVVGCSI
jgi:hypothetical protein